MAAYLGTCKETLLEESSDGVSDELLQLALAEAMRVSVKHKVRIHLEAGHETVKT